MRRLIATMFVVMMGSSLAISGSSAAQDTVITPSSKPAWNPNPEEATGEIASYQAEFYLTSNVSNGVPSGAPAIMTNFGKPPVVDNTETGPFIFPLIASNTSYMLYLRAVGTNGKISGLSNAAGPFAAQAPQNPCTIAGNTHAITIQIVDWTQRVQVGTQGKINFNISNAFAVIQLQIKIGTQVIAQIDGAELRDVGAIKFSVPRTPADYNFTVAAKDSTACTAETTTQRVVTVF